MRNMRNRTLEVGSGTMIRKVPGTCLPTLDCPELAFLISPTTQSLHSPGTLPDPDKMV